MAAGSGVPDPWPALGDPHSGMPVWFPPTLRGLLGAARNEQQKNKACLTPCGMWLAKSTVGCAERTGVRLGSV